ncbi:MAG: hypothetical protein ACXAC7_05040 [Candidatus Hodarchaeales archaeon]|jgi:hypothetical protein
MLDSPHNLIAEQVIGLLKSDDLESIVYLMQSVIPRIQHFWDMVTFISTTALIFDTSSFLDMYGEKTTIRKQLLENLFNQLEAAEKFCIEEGAFELFWILPYLKILHSPETVVTSRKIIYRQELTNFLETEIKQLPLNMGIFVIEMIINLLIRAHDDIIRIHEIQQTLNLIQNYLDNLVKGSFITSAQNAYLREYFIVLFPMPSKLTKKEMLSWIEQRIRAVKEVEGDQLIPYEQMRLEIAIRELELARLKLLHDSDTFVNLLKPNLENSYRAIQNVKQSGLILDHTLLEKNLLENLGLMVQQSDQLQEPDTDVLRQLSLEGVSYAKQQLRKLDYIESSISLGFSNAVLLALSIFAPRLVYKSKTVYEGNRIMLEVCKLSIEKNKSTLNQPHQLSGDFFYRLARVFYAIGRFSPLEYQNRIRALKNALIYAKQATAIYQFVSSTDVVNSVALEFETASRCFLILSENPLESYIELEAFNEEVMQILENVLDHIIKESRWFMLEGLKNNLRLFTRKTVKFSSNPAPIRSKLKFLAERVLSSIDKQRYHSLTQVFTNLSDI